MNEKLLKLADSLEIVVDCIREIAGDNQSTKDTAKETETIEVSKTYTTEEVRAMLSRLSTAGHTEDVRAILEKHGATKLSKVKPEDYASVMAMAAEFGGAE